ncbi:hypothetical protein ACGFJ7_28300 [Actinoplanes sp. NPDC048988]|uniref:hypothetical protein n=1 Tax=Actinoplanes sp. NPDC048988 TaxID=3363901 RepID=UPI00371C4562
MSSPVVAVHGIWNRRRAAPEAAAAALASKWSLSLAAGYRAAGLTTAPPSVAGTYYAHLLNDGAQGAVPDLDRLTPDEQRWAWSWIEALGAPDEAAQGPVTYPLRQGLDWVARRHRRSAEIVGRLMSAFLREVYVYMTRPGVRERCRDIVMEAIVGSGARIVVAHSLGSVVTYEALCANPGHDVDLLVTVGSPLALPGVVFEGLVPEPRDGRGARPAGVARWVNIADPGDLVAVPARLGDRFPVDRHDEAHLGAVDFHTLDGYLSCGLTAAAIAPYA